VPRWRQERRDHLVRCAEEGRRQRPMQEPIRAPRQEEGMRISVPSEGFTAQRPSASPHFSTTVDRSGTPPIWSRPRAEASSRRAAASALRSIIAPRRRHSLSYVVSAGNESDLAAGDFLEYLGAGFLDRRDSCCSSRASATSRNSSPPLDARRGWQPVISPKSAAPAPASGRPRAPYRQHAGWFGRL